MPDLPQAQLAAFFAAAKAYPDKVALSALTLSGAERWSYSKLSGLVCATAKAFEDEDLCEGASLPLRAEQSLTLPLAVMAAQMLKAKPVFAKDAPQLDLSKLTALPPPPSTEMLPGKFQPSDRCALIGAITEPEALAMVFAALGSGATVLFASPKVSIPQMPILLRRHDVSVIAGRAQDLDILLKANLSPWPKLRETHCLDTPPQALISEWNSRIGHGPIFA